MKGYSDNYNLIFDLYTNERISSSYPLREEIKQWLVNEREGNPNTLTAKEVKEIALPFINMCNKLLVSEEEIECCSFNLNIEYVNFVLNKLQELRTKFSINFQIDEIQKRISLADQEIEKIRVHMKTTYSPKSFYELLNNITATDFHNTLDKNLFELKNKVNELRYVYNGNESINKTLKEMLDNIRGLEFTKKHIYDYYEKDKKVNGADFQKHYGIENALIDQLNNLRAKS